jgi:hypothetical protein
MHHGLIAVAARQVLRAAFQRTLGRVKKKIRGGAIQLVAPCGLFSKGESQAEEFA